MKQEQKLNIENKQKLAISPYLYNLTEILQMPLIELEQKVYEELVENPMLELEESTIENATELFNESEYPQIEEILKYFENATDAGIYYNDYNEKKSNLVQEVLSYIWTLKEYLLWQLKINTSSDEDFKIGQTIISYINSKGYLEVSTEEIANQLEVSVEKVENVLKIIQTFEPYGVGARNLQESLIIQLNFLPTENKYAKIIIQSYFEDFKKHNYEKIAKKLNVDIKIIKEAVEIIKNLNPFPTAEYDEEEVIYVLPDIIIENINNNYIIKVNDDFIPKLKINSKYLAMLKSEKINPKIKKYLYEKYLRAISFLKSFEQRRTTTYKIAEALLEAQKDFFDKGPDFIKPLKLKDIADKLGMHESTISRITSNKYIQTKWGIFKLKYFFSQGINVNNQLISSKKIMALLKKFIETENKKKPYSDSKLVELFKKEGINISRRTVTKYREKLKILPSNLRKVS